MSPEESRIIRGFWYREAVRQKVRRLAIHVRSGLDGVSGLCLYQHAFGLVG